MMMPTKRREPAPPATATGCDPAERAEIARQLAAMTAATESLGAGVQGIDTKLEIVRDALLEATQSIRIEPQRICLDAVNTVLEEGAQDGAAIDFLKITTREFSRAYVGIHCVRRCRAGWHLRTPSGCFRKSRPDSAQAGR
jgi:hypothetical protein